MTAIVARTDRPPPPPGALTWLTTTDHKRIGILYMVTTFGFFVIAGLFSLVMRAELAAPGLQVVGVETYNELFTIHGTAMIFLFVAPFGIGLANYLLPLQVGAPDMAFPRLNALSYWLFLAGGLLVFAGFGTGTGAADAGWTAYVPLAETRYTPGPGLDLWIVGLLLTSASSIMGAINFMATAILLRAPGMNMWRLPLFTWTVLVNSLLILVSFPPLATAFTMLFVDRRLGGVFFDPAAGGSPILYQHLFWFLGHPEVYIMILPFFGVISEIVPVFSRKPLFGYVGLVLATLAIAGLSMGVWAHHMFTTGAVSNPFFAGMSFLIAVPTGIKFFNWIGTMWRGKLTFPTPMLFAIGFLLNFLLGGITGVMVAAPPLDFHVQDTHFIVAHFHYTIMGGSVFAIFAAIHFWWPKFTGWRLREGLGKATFWMMFAGFNLTFFPIHLLGLRGMPRRVADYLPADGWTGLNVLATAGSALLALSVAAFLANVVLSRRRREPAGPDPWGGNSLEWTTSSPPPEHNFEELAPIRSERPAFDLRHPGIEDGRR
ncbi:MAG: cytochrome c oxidase subunit I [Actinomycetota bacterium]